MTGTRLTIEILNAAREGRYIRGGSIIAAFVLDTGDSKPRTGFGLRWRGKDDAARKIRRCALSAVNRSGAGTERGVINALSLDVAGTLHREARSEKRAEPASPAAGEALKELDSDA
jgi:hypothetical protein